MSAVSLFKVTLLILTNDHVLEQLQASGQYLTTKDHLVKVVLSDRALAYAKPLLNTVSDNFNQILTTIVQAIAKPAILHPEQDDILTKHYPLIQDWVPKEYPILVAPAKEQYFKSLELLTELQAIFDTSPIPDLTVGVELLQQAMATLARYTSDQSLQKLMQGYSYCLGQQHEYVQFFAPICERQLPDRQAILPLLANCHEQISDNLQQQISNLSLDLKMTEANYYQQALKYLNYYPKSLACLQLEAIACASLIFL